MKSKIANKFFLFILVLCMVSKAYASPSVVNSDGDSVCFTPGGQCINLIVNNINQAKENVLIQANALDSNKVMNALISAKQRNVDVEIVMGLGFAGAFGSAVAVGGQGVRKLNQDYDIPLWMDKKPNFNQVIIIDDQTVMVGNFMFKNEKQKMAQNLLIIHNPKIIDAYTKNWVEHMKDSINYKDIN